MRSLLLNSHQKSCQNTCEALTYHLYNILMIFGIKVHRQIGGTPMGTNCTALIADLFSFLCERNFMASLFCNKEAEISQSLNSTSRYLDDL